MDNVTKLARAESEAGAKRGMSTISFPYADLNDAEQLANRLFQSGGRCSNEQLSAWLGHDTPRSGAYRNKVSAARMFGVITSSRNEIAITELGQRIVAPHTQQQARVDAFLNVPLYRRIYEAHKVGALPNDNGLDIEMTNLGVTKTQVQNARQVFHRSAEQAGFYASGKNRLVPPPGTKDTYVGPSSSDQSGDHGPDGNEPPNPPPPPPRDTNLPKVIEGLLEEAPWGNTWDEEQFGQWADLFERAARVHFKLPKRKEGE